MTLSKLITIFVVLFTGIVVKLCAGCSNDCFLDYKVDCDKFAVVFIGKGEICPEEAREQALWKASKVAKKNHYRYFVVEKQEDVTVLQTGPALSSKGIPGNAFQELIIEGDFGHKFERRMSPRGYVCKYPGVKLTIHCYCDKPEGNSYEIN